MQLIALSNAYLMHPCGVDTVTDLPVARCTTNVYSTLETSTASEQELQTMGDNDGKGMKAAAECHQQMMSRALSRIELFLLPNPDQVTLDDAGAIKLPYEETTSTTPAKRLDQILFQVSLADYIRTIQTMYRDSYDEQKLASQLRADAANVSLPTKHLVSKIVEGRSRAVALLKMGYGETSVALLKGCIDLASSYALQGLWPQVEQKLTQANETLRKISRVHNQQSSEAAQKLAIAAAERVSCVYSTLRTHTIRNNGQVLKTYVKEVMVALVQLPSHSEDQHDPLEHPSKFAAALHMFFTSFKERNFTALKQSDFADSYFADGNRGPRREEKAEPPKSWGNVVDFLRGGQCEPMNLWMEVLHGTLLPQDKAALALPFRMCDMQQREIAHPMQLAQLLLSFPSAARVVNGTKLTKALSQIKVEVPLFLDARTGILLDFSQLALLGQQTTPGAGRNPGAAQLPPLQQVFYELPITKEEYLALHLLESRQSPESQLDLLKVQLYTLQGVCHIYTSDLDSAEEQLKKALNMLEKLGLEMEIIACELYNSIAQMMIMQHRKWIAGRKDRLRDEATAWLDTDEGQKEVKQQCKILKRQYSYKSVPITTAELEMRAKDNAIKKRMNRLAAEQDDTKEMNKTLEASYRYLVRSYEILENTHGPGHPSVGTACLAVASVQNILEDFEDTRTWLMKALKLMEKYVPLPHRAISFTQVQLSQVLSRLGHDDQARMVLSNAAMFHMSQAHVGLLNHNNPQKKRASSPTHAARGNADEADASRPETARSTATSRYSTGGGIAATEGAGANADGAADSTNYSMVSPPILKNTPLFEEVNAAIEIMSRVMRMSTKCFDKWQAATQAEEIAKITELAFGWDSPEGAEAFKQAGIRCAAVADWSRACTHFKNSLEGMILLYGKMDVRTISVAKLLHSARKGRTDGVTDKTSPDGEEEEDAHDPATGEPHGDGVYGASNVIATPRTIEVAANNDVAQAYKDVIDMVNSKSKPGTAGAQVGRIH